MIRRDPLGVVASIAPWNYPLMMAAWKLAPALAAGNCVVLKPSEITPLTALKLAELAKDIFPAGVINVLFGRGKTVGDPLTGHPKVRMVSLTGSIATGEHIISHTAPSIKRTHMELGGKAPVIVFDDADIEAVVEGVRTFGYYNAGQDCTAACRIYAQKGIYDTLVEKLGAAVATLKSGAPDDESTELGPLSSLAHLERVSKAVKEYKGSLVGESNYQRFGDNFPLLIKFMLHYTSQITFNPLIMRIHISPTEILKFGQFIRHHIQINSYDTKNNGDHALHWCRTKE